jgi:hypothetical protein
MNPIGNIATIGTSASGRVGQSGFHIMRLTVPCIADTPFARRELFNAKTVTQKGSDLPCGLTRPKAINSSCDSPSFSRKLPKCSSIKSGENRSWPAATGVCVVNTVYVGTRLWARSNGIRSCFMSRSISSRMAKALCPSFRWSTPGYMLNACKMRAPPIPSSSSCHCRRLTQTNRRMWAGSEACKRDRTRRRRRQEPARRPARRLHGGAEAGALARRDRRGSMRWRSPPVRVPSRRPLVISADAAIQSEA